MRKNIIQRDIRRLKGVIVGLGLMALAPLTFASTSPQRCWVETPSATVEFGDSITSYTLQQTETKGETLQGTGLRCQFNSLARSAQNSMTAKLISANAGGGTTPYLVNVADPSEKIPYKIYGHRDRLPNSELALNKEEDFEEFQFFEAVSRMSSKNGVDVPLYFNIPANRLLDIPAGTYRDSLTINWSWEICTDQAVGEGCVMESDSDQTTLDVLLKVSEDCRITATDLNFGSAPMLEGFEEALGEMHVRCTKGSHYTIGLSNGEHAVGNQRYMLGPNSAKMPYEIYKSTDSGLSRWGKEGDERRSSSTANQNPGAGLGSVLQRFDYRARIIVPSGKSGGVLPVGQYRDTIHVDIQF